MSRITENVPEVGQIQEGGRRKRRPGTWQPGAAGQALSHRFNLAVILCMEIFRPFRQQHGEPSVHRPQFSPPPECHMFPSLPLWVVH